MNEKELFSRLKRTNFKQLDMTIKEFESFALGQGGLDNLILYPIIKWRGVSVTLTDRHLLADLVKKDEANRERRAAKPEVVEEPVVKKVVSRSTSRRKR
jgi:hypothetical protein